MQDQISSQSTISSPEIQLLLSATLSFLLDKTNFDDLKEVIKEVKQQKQESTLIMLETLKGDFKSQPIKELFYYYFRALTESGVYFNMQPLCMDCIKSDIHYLESILVHPIETQKGY